MPGFLQTWPPEQVLVLALIVAFAACLLVLILAVLRYNLRALADATALQREQLNANGALARERLSAVCTLKRELLQRGLPPHELEQAIQLLKLDEPPDVVPALKLPRNNTGKTDQQLEAEILARLAVLDNVDPVELQEIGGLLRGAGRETKEATLSLVGELEENAGGDVVVAAVRSLCRPAEKPPANGLPLETSSRITR
jgi:hypothetical protein